MSYLGYPRICFAGRFQADVSTVNNDPAHYDTSTFVARFQEFGANSTNGWWHPRGTGAWRILGCGVTGAVAADGTPAGDPADPAIGGAIAEADDRVSAKLVDLDPEQQMVSMVYGLRLALRFADGSTGFAGDFEPAPFTDIWPRWPEGQHSPALCAYYQSVIAVDDWGSASSPLVEELRSACADDKLSIKFNVDGYHRDSTEPDFTYGRIVGSIGPYLQGEPHHFVAARLLRTVPQQPPAAAALNTAPCRIDAATSTLHVDLGNSIPTVGQGGANRDVGQLQMVATPATGEPVYLGPIWGTAGTEFNTRQAGIASLKLSPAQLEAARANPLALVGENGPLLAENAEATYLRADDFVFRIPSAEPNNTASTTFYATRLGEPAAGVEVRFAYDDTPMLSQQTQGPVPGPPPGIPKSALPLPEPVTTRDDGTADLTLTAHPPGNPRGYMDGQVYALQYSWAGDADVAEGNELNVLVWDDYQAPAEPTWVADVQPILQQYANLYPIMRDVLDLSDYSDVIRYKRALSLAMRLPVTDANFMPVTRDLSPAKRDMIVGWMNEPEPPVFRIDDVASLRQVLQLAIELEHATIPPYLCAYFSLIPGQNQEVSGLIKSVVMQEMLHMALACNLLNAVGGAPEIDKPSFVPRYPGHLPAGLRPDLTVRLRRCSKEHVRAVFMSIEEPGETWVPDGIEVPGEIDVRGIAVDGSGRVAADASAALDQLRLHFTHVEHHPLTIGWFYNQIGRAFIELSKAGDVFTGDPKLQMTPDDYPGAPGTVYAIHDCDSALLAIHEIERQGEGTTLTDPVDERGELAHFFRFQEIAEGRRMVQKDGEWVFEGEEIPFDPLGVLPMTDDPDGALLPPGTQVSQRSESFDGAYRHLLRSLHATFNGDPKRLGQAVGLMFNCEVQARELMTMPVEPGSPVTAGPSFQPA